MNKNNPNIPYLEIEKEELYVKDSTSPILEGRIGIIVIAAKQANTVPKPSFTLACREQSIKKPNPRFISIENTADIGAEYSNSRMGKI